MKKILNAPEDYVTEMLEGLCAAHPEYYRQAGDDGRVIARPDAPLQGKVGIVSGGGSGHLPVFTGYVGKGLLTSCAIGEVFSSPNVDQMTEAIRCASGGAGDKVSLLCNSLGATPPEELYITYRHASTKLCDLGIEILMPLVGRYATSMEMAGMSLTICKLDEELAQLLQAPCDCAFWRV